MQYNYGLKAINWILKDIQSNDCLFEGLFMITIRKDFI